MEKERHEALSDDFRKIFGLSKDEGVIQNYKCSYGITPGTIYISQNYACFQGGKDPLKIPFIKITKIDLQGISGFHKILITTENGNHTFGVFSWPPHCRHAYNLMNHIWKNPPNYIDIQAIRNTAATIDRSNEQQQATQQRAKVNVDKAWELLKIVSETDDMQNQAMKQLQEQGEALDRIEDKLDNINDNLKRADHLMKGIESMPYYLFGGTTKKEVNDKREKQVKDRTIKVSEGAPPVIEVELLYKNGESLDPCLIVFDVEKFRIVNPKNDKPVSSGTVYGYVDVDSILIRSRNEYMDISFNTKKKDTVRLCSSFLQIITNQLFTRTSKVGNEITVVFENPTKKFEYQDEWIYKLPPRKRGTGQGKGLVGNANFTKLSSLVTDEQQKKDLDEVDNTLDKVSVMVGGIIDKGRATNKEVQRQITQLQNLEGKTDEAVGRIQNLNVRMDKAT